jgi:natural product precursor
MEDKTKMLGKLKLNQLSKNEIEVKKREMHKLTGGSGYCVCVCWGSGAGAEASRPIGGYINTTS